jgi:hypothetical protein
VKKKNADISDLDQITLEKKKAQFYLNMLIGLSAGCGVMIPSEPIYMTIMELSALEATLIQKAKNSPT